MMAAMLLVFSGLSACTAKAKHVKNEPGENRAENKEEMNLKGKNVLVAYFSWSGNTKYVAQYIAGKLSADEFEIVTEKAYPTEYDACTQIAKAEKEADARPAIKGKVENMKQYDVIFIGAPVWWYTGPMAIRTFIEAYDLTGKIVIPFCTAYSGPSQTLNDIVKATPDSDHRDGICLVTKELGGKGMELQNAKIDKWLGKIGF